MPQPYQPATIPEPRSVATVAQEDMLNEAAVASKLSRSGRVRKRKMVADM